MLPSMFHHILPSKYDFMCPFKYLIDPLFSPTLLLPSHNQHLTPVDLSILQPNHNYSKLTRQTSWNVFTKQNIPLFSLYDGEK
jgi:hypothetical protein